MPASDRFAEIVAATPHSPPGLELGHSREGAPIHGFRFGNGPQRISLIAGCHADEPVGPRLLRHLVSYLASLPEDNALLRDRQWWIVPHINPDGETRNRSWQHDSGEYDLAEYLAGAVRELPGDDIEFGFPRTAEDAECRPENRAVYDWWTSDPTPFQFHATLHGMSFAAGPWCLVESTWVPRLTRLMENFRNATTKLGYVLHDVERHGEKGFHRIERGFCTRPESIAMRDHFLALGDPETAARFRPSSMECIRTLGADPLTVVSEMPLFLLPGVGEQLGPPDPVAETWRERIDGWKVTDADTVRSESSAAGLRLTPTEDAMHLQWTLITAGIAASAPPR